MKAVIKYQANDGSEWNTAEQAETRDKLHIQVEAIMAPLGQVPEAVRDGRGWLQHELETVLTAKDGILELCRSFGYDINYPVFKNPGRECHALGIIGRILSDDGGPLGRAWSRFGRIDEQGREHQQPYYAYTAGPLPEHVCIEDRSAK